jgi:hypothetical protein
MPKFNLQAVSQFKPKVREYRNAVERVRLDRFGQLAMPVQFNLEVGLIIDAAETLVHCSRQLTPFEYSIERMRWENTRAIEWTSTLNCEAVALSYCHQAHPGKELMRVLLDGLPLTPGDTLTIEAGGLHLDSTSHFGVTFPPEDHVIYEEPDDVDWQAALVKAVNTPSRPRRRKKKS